MIYTLPQTENSPLGGFRWGFAGVSTGEFDRDMPGVLGGFASQGNAGGFIFGCKPIGVDGAVTNKCLSTPHVTSCSFAVARSATASAQRLLHRVAM